MTSTFVSNRQLTKESLVSSLIASLGVVVVTAAFIVFGALTSPNFAVLTPMIAIVCSIGVIALSIYNVFTKNPPGKGLTFTFAVIEGGLIGAFSYIMTAGNLELVGTAVVATTVAVIVSHIMYTSGFVKVTSRFRSIVLAATVAAMLFYLISFILSFAGLSLIPVGGLGIALSLVMIAIACANVIIDSDNAARAIEQGVPDDVKWPIVYSATASIVWIYIEMLRLVRNINN